MTMEQGATTTMRANAEVILHPNDLDIVCGSGGMATNHPGNKRFQAIVASHYAEYASVASKKSEKMRATRKVMADLLSSGSTRFLKKDPIFDWWYVASTRVGRDKVSHCLRQMRVKAQRERLPNWPTFQQDLLQNYDTRQEGTGVNSTNIVQVAATQNNGVEFSRDLLQIYPLILPNPIIMPSEVLSQERIGAADTLVDRNHDGGVLPWSLMLPISSVSPMVQPISIFRPVLEPNETTSDATVVATNLPYVDDKASLLSGEQEDPLYDCLMPVSSNPPNMLNQAAAYCNNINLPTLVTSSQLMGQQLHHGFEEATTEDVREEAPEEDFLSRHCVRLRIDLHV